MTQKTYLQTNYCKKGQFSNEYGISVLNYKGEETSGFFPRNSVKDNKLEVRVLEEKGDLMLLEVPGSFINGGESAGSGSYITVKKNQVSFN